MPFNCQRFPDRLADYAFWNGETYENRVVFQVSNAYIGYIRLDEAVPGALVEADNVYIFGTGIYFDQETGQIFYASNRPVFHPKSTIYERMVWTSHRLYDLERKNDRERQALKDAFAELCGPRLSLEILHHIFRFC